ncbi:MULTISPECIES: hypothetical protein [Bacteria]|uniref:Uncharacterized protein n=1 Tax=Cellulomonas carbonis T26 TaxID=947969 RepID=A0A0A0BM35_9CELL|nr:MULTISPECIES: hypothetical protein [Bacteria]KGM08960.1 hypothetical protein N868_05290 [Cellulomonas carbonis T26]KSV84440.1 hypothetical protein N184_33820 [Sinorhizobium sp. GL28]
MLNIFTLTEHIASALREELDGLTYRFKGTDEANDATETKPRVYTFTYDGELDRDKLPVHTPSVLLQVIKRDSNAVSYLVHVYVVNASIIDDEIAIDCGDESYRMGEGDEPCEYGARRDLYRACLLLGESVYNALNTISLSCLARIDNVVLNAPIAYMEQFPACECTVSFDCALGNGESFVRSKFEEIL